MYKFLENDIIKFSLPLRNKIYQSSKDATYVVKAKGQRNARAGAKDSSGQFHLGNRTARKETPWWLRLRSILRKAKPGAEFRSRIEISDNYIGLAPACKRKNSRGILVAVMVCSLGPAGSHESLSRVKIHLPEPDIPSYHGCLSMTS